MSVMEMSHRGKFFSMIAEELEADLRELLAIPANYKVLFLQGGASAQFSLIPQNILNGKTKACYVNTGAWSEKAIQDAKGQCDAIVSASSQDKNFTYIPDTTSWVIDQDAAYLHYTSNETIHGVEFQSIPDSKGLTLSFGYVIQYPVAASRCQSIRYYLRRYAEEYGAGWRDCRNR